LHVLHHLVGRWRSHFEGQQALQEGWFDLLGLQCAEDEHEERRIVLDHREHRVLDLLASTMQLVADNRGRAVVFGASDFPVSFQILERQGRSVAESDATGQA
jgi:hypothetical protein